MSTAPEAPSRGSRVKDLVLTAAVASVVSAVVAPWLRRWLGATGVGPALPPAPVAPEGPESKTDDFDERLERLLDVPDPFSQKAVAMVGQPKEDQ